MTISILPNGKSDPESGNGKSTLLEEDAPASTGNFVYDFWISIVQADAPPTIVAKSSDYSSVWLFGVFPALIDNYFRITERGSTIPTEFWGGMTTFLSMSYILVLNGVIIAGPFNTGITSNAVFFATALASGIFTTAMGLFVNVPVALAPGMGLNGFFASIAKNCNDNPTGNIHGTACPDWGTKSLPWSDAMGAVFISGWIYLFFTFTGLRSMLFDAVPKSLRASITVGIGFFITIIGLKIGRITRTTVAPWAIASPNILTAAECFTFAPVNPNGSATLLPSAAFCNNAVDVSKYMIALLRGINY